MALDEQKVKQRAALLTGIIIPLDLSVAFERAQLLDQHLFADPGNTPLKRAEAHRRIVELPENQRLPLPADDLEYRPKTVIIGLIACRHGCQFLPESEYLTK